jgi:hypothetical protein
MNENFRHRKNAFSYTIKTSARQASWCNPHRHRSPGHRIRHEQEVINIEQHLLGHGVTAYSARSATERECDRAAHRVPTDLDVTRIDQEVAGRDDEESGRGEEAPWYPEIKLTGRGGYR